MSGRRWTQNEYDLLMREYASMPLAELETTFQRSLSSIYQKAWELGLPRPHPSDWTPHELAFVTEHYADMPLRDLISHLHRSPSAIRMAAQRLNLPKPYRNGTSRKSQEFRRYTKPQDIFATLNAEAAYILGFILADGCIHHDKRSFSISNTDKGILEKIRHIFDVNNPISMHQRKTYKPCYVLRISDRTTIERLAMLGIGPRKSLTVTLPSIPDAVFFPFLRGVFDGDGNAYIHNNRYLTITFVSGSSIFIQQLANHIAFLMQTPLRSVRQVSNKRGWIVQYWNKHALAISHKMYAQPTTLFIQRKKRVFDTYEGIAGGIGTISS